MAVYKIIPSGKPHETHRQRGAAAVLAMMFLVIFASLGTAMAIVTQGRG